MRRLRSDEGGWALVTAVLLMTFMLGSSLALATYMDGQTQQSSITRVRETSFNAAETALSSQVTALTSQWPEGAAWPTCTTTSTDLRCPAATAMRALHSTADTQTGFAWTTAVRDDGGDAACGTTFYDDAATRTSPPRDADGDGCLWVRAQGTARNRTRTLVALVRSQDGQPSLPPEFAVYAGRVDFDSNAIKQFVTAGRIAARCTPVLGETTACAGFRYGSNRGRTLTDLQSNFSAGVGGGDADWGVASPTMTASQKARWKARAQELGTYYVNSCPPTMTGAVVWIDGNVSCSYSGSSVYNSSTAPGMFIMDGGSLQVGGSVEYFGIIYFPNTAGSTATVFDMQGNPRIHGAVFADGNATVNVGTSGQSNIRYERSAFEATRLPGTAGVVQNTWRELPPSSVAP